MMPMLPEIESPPWDMHPADFRRIQDDPDTRRVAEERPSPSGKFTLAVTPTFSPQNTGWHIIRGVVLAADGRAVLDLIRPYGTFPSAFIHGKREYEGGLSHEWEFLVASAPKYTGTWVYDLRDGGRALVEGSRHGNAFCVGSYHMSPDCRHMVISGCNWGGPWEYLVFNLEQVRNGFLSCISTGQEMWVCDEDGIEWRNDEVVIRTKSDDPGDEEEREAMKWAYQGMEYRVPLLKPLSFPHPQGCRCGGCA